MSVRGPKTHLALLVGLVLLAGCPSAVVGITDAEPLTKADAALDAGEPDAKPLDAEVPDLAFPDAEPIDAGFKLRALGLAPATGSAASPTHTLEGRLEAVDPTEARSGTGTKLQGRVGRVVIKP